MTAKANSDQELSQGTASTVRNTNVTTHMCVKKRNQFPRQTEHSNLNVLNYKSSQMSFKMKQEWTETEHFLSQVGDGSKTKGEKGSKSKENVSTAVTQLHLTDACRTLHQATPEDTAVLVYVAHSPMCSML